MALYDTGVGTAHLAPLLYKTMVRTCSDDRMAVQDLLSEESNFKIGTDPGTRAAYANGTLPLAGRTVNSKLDAHNSDYAPHDTITIRARV
ncbi:unnamed protein product, partial [Iphiclides podalirius]